MRKKKPYQILTFHTTSAAMAMELYCKKHGISGRLIPVPRELSAGCGLAWCVPAEERGALLDALESGGLAYEAVHEVELY